ncbi:MAG: N-acetyltransferase family protein [Chitinophagaceae bacterium]|nr:MAG: N-acetyltransferase family protein [Chitinophagaceae bacterium]
MQMLEGDAKCWMQMLSRRKRAFRPERTRKRSNIESGGHFRAQLIHKIAPGSPRTPFSKGGLPEIRWMNGIRLRPATVADAAEILAIYQPYIESSAITFEEEVPSLDAFATRISNCLRRYPWIVAEADGKVAGYAYAASYNERAAYQWACLASVYLADDYKGKGLARPLYEALFRLLRAQGYRSVFALITLPNAPSVGLHERCGFRYFTTFDNIGYKLGSWHEVGWWRLDLGDFNGKPEVPVPFAAFPAAEAERLLQA